MGRRTLVELLHLVFGLIAIHVVAGLAAWSVPIARGSIAWVSWILTAVVVVLSLRPILAARARDRAGRSPGTGDTPDA